MTALGTGQGNINGLWAALLFEELSRWGVRHCCSAAGSRSAPLSMAAVAHPKIAVITHYDERGLGYLALGLAKASGRPVAALTTSGTAVANLYPAVIEAAISGVPLIVLSADRPPELLECGANQAIDQYRLFGEYPSYFANLPCPSEALPAAMLLTALDQALAHCSGAGAGPVHLNVPLREPLYPNGQLRDFSRYLSPLGLWLKGTQPYTGYLRPAPGSLMWESETTRLQRFLDGRGLVIAGRIDRQEDAAAVADLAAHLNWPLVPDIQSQLRLSSDGIGYYDLLLNNKDFCEQLKRFDRVLQFGGRLTSKRLMSWLASRSWEDYWFVDETVKREDPQHQISHRVTQPIAPFCRQVLALLGNRQTDVDEQHSDLMGCNRELEQQLERWLAASDGLSEIFVARTITELQSTHAGIFAGNSLPVRLLDMFAASSGHRVTLYANRGASGIDGLVATAIGCCLAGKEPVTLLIGDLSLLHDLSSLGLLKHTRAPLVIVVLNNDGGGIFRMLPVPEGLRERYFQLAHGFSFAGACEMFDLSYRQPRSRADFRDAYCAALTESRATVIEVTIPSSQTAELIKGFCSRIGEHCFLALKK